MTIQILQESDVNETVQKEVTELYKQLNPDIAQLPLEKILAKEDAVFIACGRENKKIIGIALLAMYKVISGYKGMVEDVVVDKDHRGKGIGRKLMEKLLEEGKNRNLNEILLFTGHHRLPAIKLYKSLGFKLKESGLYTLKF